MTRRLWRAVAAGSLALVLAAGAPGLGSGRARHKPGLFVNGDSLAVGTRRYLPRELAGWNVSQSTSISRHASQGVALLRSLGHRLPHFVVMSLGTNDDPRAVDAFRSAVRRSAHIVGRRGCVVWPNIVRPPVAGASYAGYNRALAQENRKRRNLRVVKWTRMVRRHSYWLAGDGVHVSATGYAARAKAIAHQVRRCRAGVLKGR